jgi:hypothetical protein
MLNSRIARGPNLGPSWYWWGRSGSMIRLLAGGETCGFEYDERSAGWTYRSAIINLGYY